MDAWPQGSDEGNAAPVRVLRRESRSLVQRLRLWTPARYAAAAPPWESRGDLVAHLVQACADVAAEQEGRPRRQVPRLDSDLGLADQLAVTSEDLVRTAPDDDTARRVAAHVLVHRVDLLGEQVPATLAASLGLPDVLAAGRDACAQTAGPPGRGTGRRMTPQD